MRQPVPDLPPNPPLEWPATMLAARSPSGEVVGRLGTVDDDDTDPWTTWQVALIAAVAVLVGLAVGVATGVRIAASDPLPSAAAAGPIGSGSGDPGVGPTSSSAGSVNPTVARPAAAHDGSREHPVPLGSSHIGDGHSLRILSLGDDGAAGMRIRLELVFSGSYSGSASSMTLGLLDAAGTRHDRRQICEDGRSSGLRRALPPGEARRTDVCFATRAHLEPGSLLVVELVPGQPIHYALG